MAGFRRFANPVTDLRYGGMGPRSPKWRFLTRMLPPDSCRPAFRSPANAGFDVDLTRESLVDLVLNRPQRRLIPAHAWAAMTTPWEPARFMLVSRDGTHKKPTVRPYISAAVRALGREARRAARRHLQHQASASGVPRSQDQGPQPHAQYLADEQARLVDPKATALLLDRKTISPKGTANFFIVRSGKS